MDDVCCSSWFHFHYADTFSTECLFLYSPSPICEKKKQINGTSFDVVILMNDCMRYFDVFFCVKF